MPKRSGGAAKIPADLHITYQLQYRKCGKARCGTCKDGLGHGPYWYAYWREGPRLRSGYVGKLAPPALPAGTVERAQRRYAVLAL
ncbi:MAG TPA: hypothetical protein VID73_12765 [Ktedonobacterales bacterium]|jgi:hypothetical protein